jgi:hypothetical protein
MAMIGQILNYFRASVLESRFLDESVFGAALSESASVPIRASVQECRNSTLCSRLSLIREY